MNHRRIVGTLLLMALVVLALPNPGMALEARELGADVEPGLFARFVEWVQVAFEEITQSFVAQEGSAMTSNG